MKYAVENADSLGMNEVEMQMLMDYWQGALLDINAQKPTQPTLQAVLALTDAIFGKAKEKKLPLSRLHLHPYGSFLMCYDEAKWHDAREAIVKGSIVMPKYCKAGTDFNAVDDWLAGDSFEVPDLPREIYLPSGETIAVNENTLTYDFALNKSQGTHCYLQFFIKCKSMVKTAGMGDTISGTGFIYHEPKPAPLN